MIIGIDCSRAFIADKTGTENYSYYLVKHLLRLPESKKQQFVLFIRPNASIPDWVSQKNVQIKLINFRFLWTQLGLAWETWQTQIDVLWVPAHTLPVLRKPDVVTVVTIHGLEYQWLPEYKNLLQRWYLPLSTFYAAKAATKLIAVSTFTKNQLIKQLQTDLKKIKVIYEGVEGEQTNTRIEDGEKVLEKYGLQDKKYLLFVGTIQPRKNLPALIEAFSGLNTQYPDLKLVIAGGVGWMALETFAAITRCHVQEKVIFTGRVEDSTLFALYGDACLYVQPSFTEGFGLPVLEAMKMGIPVVTSDGGALPEIVGDAGLTIALGTDFVSHLRDALTALLSDQIRQKKLISMGYKKVNSFTWDRAAKQTLEVLLG